jgi:hypothetical protein
MSMASLAMLISVMLQPRSTQAGHAEPTEQSLPREEFIG